MNSYNIGDLIWIPDGTVTYVNQTLVGVPIKGPVCGLVLKETKGAQSGYLLVKVGDSRHGVAQKDVRKIENEERIYGQVS